MSIMKREERDKKVQQMRAFVEALNGYPLIDGAWLDDFNSFGEFQFGIPARASNYDRYRTNKIKAIIRRVIKDKFPDTITINLDIYNAPKRSMEKYHYRTGYMFSRDYWMFDGHVTL